ncbi:MAG: hypothetical protein OXS33_01010 [bacterium]|nr:hypothetical protein [bacterium]
MGSLISNAAFIVGLAGLYVVFIKLVHRSIKIKDKVADRYGSYIMTFVEEYESKVFDALERGLLRIAITRGRLSPDWEPEALAHMYGTYIRIDADVLRVLRRCRVIGRLEATRDQVLNVLNLHLPFVLILAGLVLAPGTAPFFGSYNLMEASVQFRRVYVVAALLCLMGLLIVEIVVARKTRIVRGVATTEG